MPVSLIIKIKVNFIDIHYLIINVFYPEIHSPVSYLVGPGGGRDEISVIS